MGYEGSWHRGGHKIPKNFESEVLDTDRQNVNEE
jgi:hypothetical protein